MYYSVIMFRVYSHHWDCCIRQGVCRGLNEKCFYAWKPRVSVSLPSQQKRDRLNWFKEHQIWSEHVWSHVLFTNELMLSLTSGSEYVYIWRKSGTQILSSNIMDHFGNVDVTVWGGIMINGRMALNVFKSGYVTGQIYRAEVWKHYVIFFICAYGCDFLFTGDNGRPHWVNLVDEFHESEVIVRITWPKFFLVLIRLRTYGITLKTQFHEDVLLLDM